MIANQKTDPLLTQVLVELEQIVDQLADEDGLVQSVSPIDNDVYLPQHLPKLTGNQTLESCTDE